MAIASTPLKKPTLNQFEWCLDRRLDFCPEHFQPIKGYISQDALLWISDHTTGRLYIAKTADMVAFEDHNEALQFTIKFK